MDVDSFADKGLVHLVHVSHYGAECAARGGNLRVDDAEDQVARQTSDSF